MFQGVFVSLIFCIFNGEVSERLLHVNLQCTPDVVNHGAGDYISIRGSTLWKINLVKRFILYDKLLFANLLYIFLHSICSQVCVVNAVCKGSVIYPSVISGINSMPGEVRVLPFPCQP